MLECPVCCMVLRLHGCMCNVNLEHQVTCAVFVNEAVFFLSKAVMPDTVETKSAGVKVSTLPFLGLTIAVLFTAWVCR